MKNLILTLLALWLVAESRAASTIHNINRYAWGRNVGWTDWRALILILLFEHCLRAAPTPPRNLRLLQQGPDPLRLAFRWDPPASGSPASYQVYLNGWFQAGITGTIWVDDNLLPDTEYQLTVRAVDGTGEVSGPASLSARTLPIPPLRPAYHWNTVLLRYADYPDAPFTPSEVNHWVYGPTGSVNAYFSEVSYGRTSITGQVHGWYTLPQPASHYHTRGENQGLWWGPDLQKIIADMAAVVPPEAGQNVEGQILILHGTGDAGSAAGFYKMISRCPGSPSWEPFIFWSVPFGSMVIGVRCTQGIPSSVFPKTEPRDPPPATAKPI